MQSNFISNLMKASANIFLVLKSTSDCAFIVRRMFPMMILPLRITKQKCNSRSIGILTRHTFGYNHSVIQVKPHCDQR